MQSLNSPPTEAIVIAGAGMAGLATALALAGPQRTISLYDRDPSPPDVSAEEAFHSWDRKGVTQLRHSHVFLGRLFSLIRDRYPGLLKALLDAGAREMTMADGVPLPLRAAYQKAPGDEDMSILFCRRTTLEYVMRRTVAALPGVRIVTDAPVKSLIMAKQNGRLVCAGVEVETDAGAAKVAADIVIDATGRNSILIDACRSAGATIAEEESPAGILYFTRHYKLREGQEEPARDMIPGAGDLGFLKYGVFIADNRHFSITLAVPEIEITLRTAIQRPETFDAICASLPGCARWTDTGRSEPVSKVFAMGNLRNLWRCFLDKNGAPEVLNFFAVGDSANRTNPLYGRGCSSAFVQAECLAEAFGASGDPVRRARSYDKLLRRAVRPHWDAIVKQDQAAIRRARHEQDPTYQPRLKARWVKSFVEDAVGPATRGDMAVFRALMKGFHMLEAPALWLRNPIIVARVLYTWMRPKAAKLHLYPPRLGPGRADLLKSIGLKLS